MADKGIDSNGLLYILQRIKANFALKSHTHSTSDINSGNIVTGVKGNSETNYRTGQVNITAANVGAAASSHTHGNIQSGGTLQTNDVAIANGDKLVITDSSDSSKVARASIAFDGSTATQALTKKGTWETFNNYSLPTASDQVKGGVKIGSGLGMSGEVLSVDIPNAQETSSGSGTYMSGLMSGADKAKLDGIASGANNYSLPTAGADTKGGVKIGAGLTMTGEVLSADVQSVPVMTGAAADTAGTAGTVPAPAAGDQAKYLQGDGTWDMPAARHGSGSHSVNEGVSCTTSGNTSHAEGSSNTASGSYSHVEGLANVANHESQHVFGEYNVPDDSSASSSARGNYIEIVGNGTLSAHSNARTLDWSGNEVLAGTLTTGGDITVPSGSKFNGSGAGLTSLNGSNISSGTVAEDRIAGLPASKITSGTFSTARIPDLPATKLPTMTGAKPTADGTAGIVPAPTAGSQSKVLAGGGWSELIAYISSAANSPAPYTNYNRQLHVGVNNSNTNYLGTGILIPNASSSEPGFMSSADKSKLDAFGAASTYALKSDITAVYKHKGSVSTKTNLPTTGNTAGDVYNVVDTGMNYVWVVPTSGDPYWDDLGSLYEPEWMTNSEIDAVFTSAGLTATA